MKITPEKYWELRHREEELINHRIGWLLTSQIVLFAAYGILLKENVVPGDQKRLIDIIEWLGLTIACLIFAGIITAVIASWVLYRKVNSNLSNPPDEKQTLGVHPILTIIGWLVAALIPVIFIIAWIKLL
jgi:heme/copper-type cytochrome/quinol oxidase subunit 2